MTEFTATARRDGKWWVVQCDQHPTAFSQVTRLDRAEEVHREAIAFVADIPIADVTVTVRPVKPRRALHQAGSPSGGDVLRKPR